MKKYGLLAHPTKYSLSPKMWTAAFKALGSQDTYGVIDVLPEDFATQFPAIKAQYCGLSVSMPHKETILPLLDSISLEAKAVGAVNTVRIENGKAHGFNTDWIGVDRSLAEIPDLVSKKVLINGTGGATRAAIYALNRLGVVPYVCGRNQEKLELLNEDFNIEIVDSLSTPNIEVFINGTPIGLEKDERYPIEDETLGKFKYVFDMVYGETELLRRARGLGVKTINGFEMVLHQGFEQFKILTDLDAPKEVMRTAIYS